ncbi:hypothetical protein PINS_up002637 [Pythium insidiosum]|nr:hypothetical protein PINS_up002637 [Pythium insidiosum]
MSLSLGASVVSSGARFLAEQVCQTGVWSCSYGPATQALTGSAPPGFSSQTCAPYNGAYADPINNYWLLVITAVFAASMAFSIGANDGANAWATTIHSFAIKLRPACVLAAVFEILGASTIGYGVSTSIQKGITKLSDKRCFACGYCDSSMSLYYIGMMASLVSTSIFLIGATLLRMPVSTTHAIVSAVFGMTVVFHGFGCVEFGWENLGGIVASWFISPIAAGVASVVIYYAVQWLIFQAPSPRQRAFVLIPVLYGVVVFIITFLTFVKSPVLKSQPHWKGLVVGGSAGAFTVGVVVAFVMPRLKTKLPSVSDANRIGAHLTQHSDAQKAAKFEEERGSNVLVLTPNGVDQSQDVDGGVTAVYRPSLELLREYDALSIEQQDAMFLFKHLLVMVACLQSFSHGSNDTANATAAFAAVLTGFRNGLDDCRSPESAWWVMTLGGLVLGAGIWFLGYKVMDTIGKNICIVSFDRAFCTEFASACTVVACSLLRVPVSTTHCQVGAVVCISLAAKDRGAIQWRLVVSILFSWILTLPLTAGLSGAVAYALKYAIVG